VNHENGIINEFIAAPDATSTLDKVLIQLLENYVGPKLRIYGREWVVVPPEYDECPQHDGHERCGD
jgi:hypothetical protein